MTDEEIMDERPWIIAHAEHGCRWLPLRGALRDFDAMRADTLLMNEWGLLVRTKPNYVWYAWPRDRIVELRLAGYYANTLMAKLLEDICEGRCIYPNRPDRTF